MHRAANFCLLLFTVVSAFALYALKYDTRRLELEVQAHERTVEKLQAEIGMLKAEYAHLARPQRIETLARALGLAPVTSRQYLRLGAGLRDAVGETPAPAPR
jgi:cell division protein FtsL